MYETLGFVYCIISSMEIVLLNDASHPHPDRSACLCIAGAFSSSLSIMSFVLKVLKQATAVQMTREQLLDVVESMGNQLPYENQRSL